MASRIQVIKFSYYADDGSPLAGGKVYFYESGTSTPKDTYTDSTEGTANANPVILDARGEADIYVRGKYKIKVYDSDDNLVEEQDNYSVVPVPYEIGDYGTEAAGINIGGTVYKPAFRVNDLSGEYPAEVIYHRHDTSLHPLVIGARSNSTGESHGAVTNGQILFAHYAAGWTGSHYDLFGESRFSVDDTGTVSTTSSPAKWDLLLTPDGSNVLAKVITAKNDKSVEVYGSLCAPDNLKDQRVPINFTSDADYTLTADENKYSQIELTDTGVVLTTTRSVIIDSTPKLFSAINSTAQTLNIKTVSGTPYLLHADGRTHRLYSDGTDVTLRSGPYISAEQTITSAGLLTLPHGLGSEPDFVSYRLICKTAEANYSIGDIIDIDPTNQSGGALSRSSSVILDSTNISIRYSSDANVFIAANKTTGNTAALTNSSWRLIIKAWVFR